MDATAKRKALDVLRRDKVFRSKMPMLVEPEETGGGAEDAVPDDRLRLVFTCCHPALAREAQIALTLRLVCGVGTGDIAHAFLVSEATMAARPTRAKKKITAAPHPVPGAGGGRPARAARHGAQRAAPALHHRSHRADRRRPGAGRPGRPRGPPGPGAWR